MAKAILETFGRIAESNPQILVSKENLRTHLGTAEADLEEMGLSKSNLIRLSRLGIAVKGYAQHEKSGVRQVRWLFVIPEVSDGGN